MKPLLPALWFFVFAASAQEAAYLNPALPREQRVDDLVSRMTLEEKASQLVNQARAIPRLQVPAYDWWSEALHGVAREGTATVFPQAIGLGATWDAPLIHDMATVIGIEARAKHHDAVRHGRRDIFEGLTFWSPNINIFRDPRWGRGQETYGEDPFLTARIGVAFVTGLQGDDPKYLQAVATPKHFAVHSGPEPARHGFNVEVSRHDMEDTYLPAFRATVTEAKAQSVMCAYNRINGEPACASTFLLKDELRGAWGFDGFVVSDCDAVADIWRGHHYTKTLPEAAAVSLKLGTDNDCADFRMKVTDNLDYMKYVDAVKQGLLTEKDIDVSVKRLFRARFALGMFDPPEMVKYAQTPLSANDTEEHRQLALNVARESMVLLKNDGVLPLPPHVKRIAVVGPLADSLRVLEGNYNGTPSQPKTALDGIRKQFAGAKVAFAPGMKFLRDPVAVPASALTTTDGQLGLKAEYFNSVDLSGTPVVTRIDPQINFRFISYTVPGLDAKGFSVRWTGVLTPSDAGTYTLAVTGGDTYRLWLNGKVLIDNPDRHGGVTKNAELRLERGHKYAIRLEYFDSSGNEVAKLSWLRTDGQHLEDAVAAAKLADVVIAAVGITADLEGEEMKVDVPGFAGGDRTSIDLPKEEEDLLKAVKDAGKPLVVVLMNGSPLAVNWASQNANAILEAWYPGEEGGTAIAETLAGTNNPAGRLPVTFYKGLDRLPPFVDYAMKNRTYRYFQGKPLYPFGYGLSFTKFEFRNLKTSSKTVKAGDSLDVDVDVRNMGARDGDAVAELYLSFPPAPGMPIRALRGFSRVHLANGQTQHVHFKLDPRDLSSVTEAGDRVVAPGAYRISVGGGQPGMGASVTEAQFTVEGEQKLPE
ncbi:MAG: glycoside hydrolase family 3 C-terminal domain-containing protein [Bryobacteraceae bacterium]